MREFNDYMTLAIDRQKLKSNNHLARELNLTTGAISILHQGKSLPSEDTMIKLAELAGLPKEEALIDLNLWRSKNNPELNKIWQRLAKMIGLLFFFYLFSPSNSNACNPQTSQTMLSDNASSIYIMLN